MKPKAILNWSGGKDCAMALYESRNKFDFCYLFTSVNSEFKRVSMHGLRVELLHTQAEHIGIPIKKLLLPEMPSMKIYNNHMEKEMKDLKTEGINYSVFGDIFLEDLRLYREEQLSNVAMQGVFPLWKRNTKELLEQFLDLGFKAVIVCVNEKYLDKKFAGRILDKKFVHDIPANVDPCGENGEFHTFVFDGPIFNNPVSYKKGEIVHRKYQQIGDEEKDNCFSSDKQNFDTGFWYCDILPY